MLKINIKKPGPSFNIKTSYKLSHEYRVKRNRYSWLLFTSEDRLCANLHVQEQLTNMTSQCQCFAFAWRHRSFVMTQIICDDTDHLWWRHNAKSEKTVLGNEMRDRCLFVAEWCVQYIKKRVRNKIIHSLPWITIFGHSWGDLPMIFVKIIGKSPHLWPKNHYSQ